MPAPSDRERRRSPRWPAAFASVVTLFGFGLSVAEAGPRHDTPRAAAGVLFVNFDGAVITGGPDDASSNTSEVAEQFGFIGTYPPYGGSDAQRASVLAAIRGDWESFDVDVVDSRPSGGAYAMTMIGPLEHPFGGGVNSAGPVDCYDANPRNISFVFYGPDDLANGASTAVQATEVSQEFAHALGLEHVTGSGSEADIMYPTASSPTSAFVDECFALAPGATCQDMHAELSGCAEAARQNTYRELLGLFGAAQSDVEPPSVAITTPEDGAQFEVGDAVEVAVDADDDVGIVEVELAFDGESRGALIDAPFEWVILDAGVGEHQLFAVARDAAGNETVSASVVVLVEPEPGDPAGGPGGCGCAAPSGPRPGSFGLALLVLVAGLGRTALRRND